MILTSITIHAVCPRNSYGKIARDLLLRQLSVMMTMVATVVNWFQDDGKPNHDILLQQDEAQAPTLWGITSESITSRSDPDPRTWSCGLVSRATGYALSYVQVPRGIENKWVPDPGLGNTIKVVVSSSRGASLWMDRTCCWDSPSTWAAKGLLPYAMCKVMCHVAPMSAFPYSSREDSELMDHQRIRQFMLEFAAIIFVALQKDNFTEELSRMLAPNLVRIPDFLYRLETLSSVACDRLGTMKELMHNNFDVSTYPKPVIRFIVDGLAEELGEVIALGRAWPTAERRVGNAFGGTFITKKCDDMLANTFLLCIILLEMIDLQLFEKTLFSSGQKKLPKFFRQKLHWLTQDVLSSFQHTMLGPPSLFTEPQVSSTAKLARSYTVTGWNLFNFFSFGPPADPVIDLLREAGFWSAECYDEDDKSIALLGYVSAAGGGTTWQEALKCFLTRQAGLDLSDADAGCQQRIDSILSILSRSQFVHLSVWEREGCNSLPALLGTGVPPSCVKCHGIEDLLHLRLRGWKMLGVIDAERYATELPVADKISMGLALGDEWDETRFYPRGKTPPVLLCPLAVVWRDGVVDVSPSVAALVELHHSGMIAKVNELSYYPPSTVDVGSRVATIGLLSFHKLSRKGMEDTGFRTLGCALAVCVDGWPDAIPEASWLDNVTRRG